MGVGEAARAPRNDAEFDWPGRDTPEAVVPETVISSDIFLGSRMNNWWLEMQFSREWAII
jgi:hypothetical protein